MSRWLLAIVPVFLFGCGGSSESNNIPSLQISPDNISIMLEAGNNSRSERSVVTLPDNTYSLTAGYATSKEQPAWINYSVDTFTLNSSTADFNVTARSNGLSMGDYADNIVIVAKDIAGTVLAQGNVQVTLTVADPLQTSRNRLEFYTANGTVTVPGKTVSLFKTSSSGTWVAASDQPWLTLNATSGSTPFDLEADIDLNGLATESYTANLAITDNETGSTIDIPVSLFIEPHRLEIDDNGIALSSFPSRSRLSHTINIGENGDNATSWSALSDSTWLGLSAASGNTSEPLTITADPAGLAPDTIHYANINITSLDTSIVNSESVRVGLYISSVDSARTTISGLALTDYPSGLAADPVRPYVYVSNLGTEISVYNVVTGNPVTAYTGNAGSIFSELEVSSNGTYLYVTDRGDNSIKRINLETGSLDSTWSGINFPTYDSVPYLSQMDLRYTRVNGYPILVTSGIQVLDANNGTVMASLEEDPATFFRPPMIALSRDGKSAFASLANYVYFDLYRYNIHYSYNTSTAIARRSVARPRDLNENAPLDMTISHDGSQLLALQRYNSNDQLRAYTNDENVTASVIATPGITQVAITTGPTGKTYTLKRVTGDDTIYTYDAALSLEGTSTLPTSGLNRQLVTSGDGMRLILRSREATEDQLVIINVAP